MKVLIVEDEYIARERLKRFLKKIESVELIEEAENKQQALEKVRGFQPDVIILDIKLPDSTGVEIAREILSEDFNPYIIFATAYSDYAVEAFKLNAIDYIMKPFEYEDVKKAFEKIGNLKSKEENLQNISKFVREERDFLIPAKGLNKVVLLKPDDIYYIKAELSETVVRTKDNEYFSKRKLYEFEQLLSHKNFFKVHKSYLVNLSKIKELKSVEQSKFLISFIDIPDKLKSSRDGAKKLREYLDI